jgi:crossover junction endodeoxyribonuclease RuvC
MLCAGRRELEVTLYSPSEVKLAVTGGGRASKDQVRFMVERILGQNFSEGIDDDVSDALAVALCDAGRQASPLTARGGV